MKHSIVGMLLGTAALAFAGPVHAAQRPITLKVSKPGYTVVALGPNGRAASARARGVVRLKSPTRSVTLHLIAANGSYAGPVVVGGRGSKVVVGVRAGAKLGLLRVRKGYAVAARPLRRAWLDVSKTAAARAGVPLGARVFGRVKAKASGPAGAGVDQDRDGIPGAYDIDDDGDLILDNFERRIGFVSIFGFRPFAEPGDVVELDCGGLSYCSKRHGSCNVRRRRSDLGSPVPGRLRLAASGAWGSGQSLKVDIQARSEFGDNAAQAVFFKRN